MGGNLLPQSMDVIFDLDGTLADCTHRLHHIKGDDKDWDAFHADVHLDTVHLPIKKLLLALLDSGHRVVFCTGRMERGRKATEQWLDENIFDMPHDPLDPEYSPYDELYMRPEDDHRPDTVVKLELLARIRADGYNPVMAIEDRASVVAMWRNAGLTCLQVAEGNF